MHGGAGKRSVNNVVKFSRNGCTLSTSVLEESEEVNLRELRGLALLPSGSLIVLNAYRLDTQALLYGSCSPDDHTTRPFTGRILDHGSEKKKKQQKDTAPTATTVDSDNGDDDALDPLLVHSYGLAVNAESTRVFVSNQDTCSVTSSSVLGNEPDEILALRFSPCGRRDDDFDDDAVSSTDDGDSSMSRLRGIALDSKGLLYIAHQEVKAPLFSSSSSLFVARLLPPGRYYYCDFFFFTCETEALTLQHSPTMHLPFTFLILDPFHLIGRALGVRLGDFHFVGLHGVRKLHWGVLPCGHRHHLQRV
jgi:hypothetical protein